MHQVWHGGAKQPDLFCPHHSLIFQQVEKKTIKILKKHEEERLILTILSGQSNFILIRWVAEVKSDPSTISWVKTHAERLERKMKISNGDKRKSQSGQKNKLTMKQS